MTDDTAKTAVVSASILVGAVAVVWMLQRTRRGSGTGEPKDSSSSKKSHQPESWESKIPKSYGPLKETWPGCLYVLEADGTSQGPPIRNMIIYRPPGGDRRLVILSGIAVKNDRLNEILALGEPTVLVVPNFMHRDCARVWKDRFPSLLVVAPEVAVEKASEVVPVDMTTQQWAQAPDWSKVVTTLEVEGWKPFETVLEFDLGGSNKMAFVVTDLLFTMMPSQCCTTNGGWLNRFIIWLFDSVVVEPSTAGEMVIPKVSRVARLFGIADWKKAEHWYRTYAKENGSSVAVLAVGHGPPIVEFNAKDGCTAAFVGVADQLTKPRW
jgi:hypothetical protein